MKQKIPGKNFLKILGVHVSCKVVLFSRNSIITGSIRKLIKLEFFIEWKAPFELKASALFSPHWLVHCQHVLFQSGFEDSLENPRRSYILGR